VTRFAPQPPHEPAPWTRWAGRLALAAFVLVFAVVAGMQIAEPDKRVIQVVAAGLVVLLAFRSASISALALTVLMLPFPKGTSYGSTNTAFISLLFVVWLFRVTTKRTHPPGRTVLDLPILGLVMAYCLSFYNVARADHIPLAWAGFTQFLTYVFLMYMVYAIVRSTSDVRKILTAQAITCLVVCLFGVYEQLHPEAVIIPGWISFSGSVMTGHGVRIGSTFLDYELFGEYCALNLMIQFFLFTRATTKTRRWLIVGLMLLTFYCLFATVTRGALITFMAGLVYLAWLSRHRLNFVKLTTAVALAVGLLLGGDYVASHVTNSSSTLERLFVTKLENGMPDSRAPAWKAVWKEVEEKPLIGHGPYYSLEEGLGLQWWPHNVYLYYAYIVGLVGLFFFLWILRALWQSSRPLAASLGSGTYVEGATVVMRVVLFMFMLDQLKIDYLRNGTYSFFVWFLFGLILAVHQVALRERALPVAVEADREPALRPPTVRPVAAARQAVAASPAVGSR
jgi:putative inorganic carbon (HCO3(-)) transporter